MGAPVGKRRVVCQALRRVANRQAYMIWPQDNSDAVTSRIGRADTVSAFRHDGPA